MGRQVLGERPDGRGSQQRMEATVEERKPDSQTLVQKCQQCGKLVTDGLVDFDPDEVCEECYERLTEDQRNEGCSGREGGEEGGGREIPF